MALVNDWELCKENVQPLKQGRNMTALNSALHPQQDTLIKEQSAFEKELRSYQGNDPLDVWYRYLKWTEQYFPSGKSTQVRRLAEKCIKALNDDKRYTNDMRWLEMWWKVARNSANIGSLEIYQAMRAAENCTKLAPFYIQWATELEEMGDLKAAADVYHDGLRSGAKPVTQMQDALSEFEMRVARKMEPAEEKEEDDYEPTRNFLGVLKPVGKTAQAPFNRATNPLAGVRLNNPPQQQDKPNRKIEIYDENAKPTCTSKVTLSQQPFVPEVAVLNKENTVEPGVWKKNKIPSTSVPLKNPDPPKPAFNVYVDSDVQSFKTPAGKPFRFEPAVLSQKKPSETTESGNILCCLTESGSKDPRQSSQNPKEKHMYCKDKLENGLEEMQFEELRAMRWLENKKEIAKAQKSQLKERNEPPKPGTRIESVNSQLSGLSDSRSFSSVFESNAVSSQKGNVLKPPERVVTSAKPETAQAERLALQQKKPLQPVNREIFKETGLESVKPPPLKIRGFEQYLPEPQPASVLQQHRNGHDSHSKSPDPNGTYTQNVYKDAIAMFSNTLHFSGTAEDDKAYESSFQNFGGVSSAFKSDLVMPFAIFDENAPTQQQKQNGNIEDKENIQPSGYSQMKEKRQLSGYLTPSLDCPTEAPTEDADPQMEANPLEGIQPIVDDRNEFNGDTTLFDPTLARFLMPTNMDPKARVMSTPLHQGSRLPPPSFSSLKPGEVMRYSGSQSFIDKSLMEDVALPVANDMPPQHTFSAPQLGQPDMFGVTPKENKDINAALMRDIYTIVETSTEYKSSSSSGSDASSRRHISGTQSARLQTISESDHYWQTPGSSARPDLLSTTPFTVLETFDQNGVFSAPIPGYSDAAVRRLSLKSEISAKKSDYSELKDVDENCERTGFGLKAWITSGIDPFDPAFQAYLLAQSGKRLDNCTNFHHFGTGLPHVKIGCHLELGGEVYLIKELLGEGAFARAFRGSLSEDSENDVVLKVQKPACPWEFYVCEEAKRRLKGSNSETDMCNGIMSVTDAYLYTDGSILVNEFHRYGTLLNLANQYKTSGNVMDEMVCVFLTIEMFRVAEALHSVGIVHADIKPDNFVLTNIPPGLDDLSQSSAEELFSNQIHSIKLIDFGRAIDMKLLPADITFTGKAATSGFICTEMMDNREWTYQTDYFGILGTIHVLAFGEYMKVYKSGGRWKCTACWKRRWNQNLWKNLFDCLLNVPDCNSLPDLSMFRRQFEEFFVQSVRNNPNHWEMQLMDMRSLFL